MYDHIETRGPLEPASPTLIYFFVHYPIIINNNQKGL